MLAAGIVAIGLVGYGKLVHAPFLVIELIALWLVGSGEDDHCRQSVGSRIAVRQIVRVVSPLPDILSIECGLRHCRFFVPIVAGEFVVVVPCPQMRFIPSHRVVEIYGELEILLVFVVWFGVDIVEFVIAPLRFSLCCEHVDLIVLKGHVGTLRGGSASGTVVEYKLCRQCERRVVSSVRPLIERNAVVVLVNGCNLSAGPVSCQFWILRIDVYLAPVLLVAEIDCISLHR